MTDGSEDVGRSSRAVCTGEKALSEINSAIKFLTAANIADFFGMLPLIGIPFGILRTAFTSKAGSHIEVSKEDISEFDILLRESGIDLTPDENSASQQDQTGRNYDYISPNVSSGHYITTAISECKKNRRRISSALGRLTAENHSD